MMRIPPDSDPTRSGSTTLDVDLYHFLADPAFPINTGSKPAFRIMNFNFIGKMHIFPERQNNLKNRIEFSPVTLRLH